MDQPNEVGDWIQIAILGSGAFGTVMLWRNQVSSDFVAIKKCKFQKASALSAKQKDRWHMEVEFLKSINHANIIGYKQLDPVLEKMINKYNPTKLPLLPMEYCRKGNLRRYLTSDPIKLCGLPEHDVRYILEDISSGLSYLHSKKITHRDIKPDNIVLQHCDNRKGETVYKIIDLGYAKELQDATLSFVGTLHYLAPEIFYNQNYNQSVDYWSMGTMVFEIVCGTLPFLPEIPTPFERFEKIKDKGPEDICIYMSHSGSITTSTEIKRENFVTSCFKQNIESWLKRVLQMDPAKRIFSKDLSPFDYLRFILDKKIIQVFSVYKQEFYSYEVNDSTLFGTLKEWISRDIKIPKTDLLFLFWNPKSNQNQKEVVLHCSDDNTLLQYLTCDTDVGLYVFKKEAMFCDKNTHLKMPALVKELFTANSNFQVKHHLRNVYRQAIFYVYNEMRAVGELKNAYICLLSHIEDLCEKIKYKYVSATNEFSQVTSRVQEMLLKRTQNGLNVDLSEHPEVRVCLSHLERLLKRVEGKEKMFRDFAKQYRTLVKQKTEISNGKIRIEAVFDKCDIETQFNKINGKSFLEKPKNGEMQDPILSKIKNVVSETLKMKYNLMVRDSDLRNCSNDLCTLLKWTEQLLTWIDRFIISVQCLSDDLSTIEEQYSNIISDIVKVNSLITDSMLSFNLEDTENIVKENQELRLRLENLLIDDPALCVNQPKNS